MGLIAISEHPPPEQPIPIPMMVKNYQVQTPFDPSTIDTAMLKTMLIPIKAIVRELNEYIQMIETEIRSRR